MEVIDLKAREVFSDQGRGISVLVDEPDLKLRQVGLEPGQEVPLHEADAPVLLQVLRGEGVIAVDGREVRLGPGKLLRVPAGTVMGIRNEAGVPLVFLVLKTPSPAAGSVTSGQGGSFVNIVEFAPLKPGREEAFMEWFRRSSEVFARHRGFISRSLLGPIEGASRYAAVVEHQSQGTFMDMHLSDDRQELVKEAEPFFLGEARPSFYRLLYFLRKGS